jgi:hypothetical protein
MAQSDATSPLDASEAAATDTGTIPVADSAAPLDASLPEASIEGGVDASTTGSLYVVGSATPGPSVAVFATSAAATTPPLYTIAGTFFTSPTWVQVDPVADLLYVQDGAKVLVFPAAATTPSRTITSAALLGNITRIGADGAGNVYVGSVLLVSGVTVNGIAVFGPTAGTGATPTTTFSCNALGSLTGIAVDANGNIFLASSNQQGGYNAILEFAPNPSGFATPTRTIGGGPNSHIGQDGLGWLAVDASGSVYASVLANGSNPADSIEVYDTSVTGDQAPTREITGSATKLSSPTVIAVDAAGNLSVSNAGGSGTPITTFAPMATGNVAPIRSLFPTTTGGFPTGGLGIAVGP